MSSSLIAIAGPPLPGRWALARAVARRLCARLAEPPTAQPRHADECVVVQGDLPQRDNRAQLLSSSFDERVLIDWMSSEHEARREIFHRWASRPLELAERELERYLAWSATAEPVSEHEADTIRRVGAHAPLADQVLAVVSSLKPRSESLPSPRPRTHVLLVDDDDDQRQLLGEVLEELGCNVERAPDAWVALALLDTEDHGIDLIFSDERMPGMTGVELAAEVARRHPEVGAVLITAHADPDMCARALLAHARTVLRKPVSVVDLQRVLEDAR